MSAYLLERDGKESFLADTPGSDEVPEGHIVVKVLIECDPCILARVRMLEDRVSVLERELALQEYNVNTGNDERLVYLFTYVLQCNISSYVTFWLQ